MSAAARPVHYFDTVHNGVAPRKTERRSATEILRGSAAAPTTREYLHNGSVQRATERRMRQMQAQAYTAVASRVPRHVRIHPFVSNAFAHDTIEHVSFFRIGAVDTTYNGQKVRVVLSGSNAPCYPYFGEDGKQRLKDLPGNILDDKVKQPMMYWGHIEDMDGKPITTTFKDALVFRTTDFNEVIRKCVEIAPPAPTQRQTAQQLIAPLPSMQSRGLAYAS